MSIILLFLMAMAITNMAALAVSTTRPKIAKDVSSVIIGCDSIVPNGTIRFMAEEKPESTVKRTTAKRTTKKATAKKVARRVTTKTAVRKAAPRRDISREKRGMSFGFLFGALLFLFGSAVASLYFGYNDQGQINVAKQIEKNAGIGINGEATNRQAPAGPGNSLPNSGMVPSRRTPEPTPLVEESQASTTDEAASTTADGMATSTEAVVEEDSNLDAVEQEAAEEMLSEGVDETTDVSEETSVVTE